MGRCSIQMAYLSDVFFSPEATLNAMPGLHTVPRTLNSGREDYDGTACVWHALTVTTAAMQPLENQLTFVDAYGLCSVLGTPGGSISNRNEERRYFREPHAIGDARE